MEQLSDNRKKIREAFRSGQINAICGYPGIGKTYLTHQMKPETPWYDAQTACETAIRQQFRGGDVCAVLG